MRKLVVLTLAVVGLVGVLAVSVAVANDDGGKNTFRAKLNGWQEVPSQVTTGHGSFHARVVGNTIHYVLEYRGLEGPATSAAHIHVGSFHENGQVSAFLCGGGDKPPCDPQTDRIEGDIDSTDVIGPTGQGVEVGNMADLLKAMRRGESYANVHTEPRAPGGEIRGQIRRGGNGKGDNDDDD